MSLLVTGWKQRDLLEEEKAAFSPQNKPSLPAETGGKERRNPPQKAPAHKDVRNILTPSEPSSNPPRGPEPPFHTSEGGRITSWFKAGLEHFHSESDKSGTFSPSGHPIVEESPFHIPSVFNIPPIIVGHSSVF